MPMPPWLDWLLFGPSDPAPARDLSPPSLPPPAPAAAAPAAPVASDPPPTSSPTPAPGARAASPSPRPGTTSVLAIARALAGGRLTEDGRASASRYTVATLVSPDDWEGVWRMANLDVATLDKIAPTRLMEALVTLSPEMSAAAWYFNRLANPGWEVTVTYPGSDRPHAQGQEVTEAFIRQLGDLHGSIEIVINRLFTAAYVRGATLAELVPDLTGRVPVDLVTPDPLVVRFQRQRDPVRGEIAVPGQQIGGKFVAYDRPTIIYLPIDPLPGSPYGRSLIAPALHSSLFLLTVLHDLRRVVGQQGYHRLDIEVILELLEQQIPTDVATDPDKRQQWLIDTIDEIKTTYRGLQPDDAFIHTNTVKVNRPVGTVDSTNIGGITQLIDALVRIVIRSLKMPPLLLGVTDGVSEANANRQWEMLVATVKSVQHLIEHQLGRLFALALQMQGIQAEVTWTFATIRAAELLRDAQAEGLVTANAIAQRDAGFIDQDEAAMKAVGHPATGEERTPPPPPDQADDEQEGEGDDESEQGSERGALRRLPPLARGYTPEGAADDLPALPAASVSVADLARAAARWDETMPRRWQGLLDAALVEEE